MNPLIKRIIIALCLSSINYGLIELAPDNKQLYSLITFVMAFNLITMVGLLLQLPKSISKQLISLLAIALFFAYPITYLSYQPYSTGFYFLWFLQAQFSLFIVLSFYCSYYQAGNTTYPQLFYHSWRILLSMTLASLFCLFVWGLLLLASLLFNLIGIQIIDKVIYSKAMFFIGSPVFFAVGISLLAQFESILNKVRQVVLSFATALYPLLLVIGLGYLLAVPFSPKPLSNYWGSIYLLIIIHLFLFNGVYQSGRTKPPYPKAVNLLLKLFILLQPIYLMYAMSHPISNLFHDMTTADAYFAVIGTLLLAYSISYASAIIKTQPPGSWLPLICTINKVMAIVTAILFWLMATPIMNLEKWIS